MRIKRHPRTEFLVNSRAPARIIARRMTAAVDEKARLSDILNPETLLVEPNPVQPAKIMHRRHTAVIDTDTVPNSEPIIVDSSIRPREIEQHGTKSYVPRSIVFANEENFHVSIQSSVPSSSSRVPLLPIRRNSTNDAEQNANRDRRPNLAKDPYGYIAYLHKKLGIAKKN